MFKLSAALLLVAVCGAAAAAAPQKAASLPITNSLRGPSGEGVAAAAAAPAGYYEGTVVQDLKLLEWQNCAEGLGFSYTAQYACGDDHDYNSYDNDRSFSEAFRPNMPGVVSCRWQLLPTYPTGPTGYTPTMPINFGKALVNCYANGAADKCKGPLCNGMVLSGQADLWITYARYTQNTDFFPATDSSCAFDGASGRVGAPRNFGQTFMQTMNALAGRSVGGSGGRVQTAAAEPAAANYGYHHDDGVTGYPGIAITATGLLSVVGADKAGVEDTVLFEVTPFFSTGGTGSSGLPIFGPGFTGIGPPPANAPFVRPGHLQIQFTKEEGPHGSGY